MEKLSDIFQHAQTHFEKQLPFIIYSKPGSHRLHGLFQNDNSRRLAKDFTEVGFIFAPFDGKDRILIPAHESTVVFEDSLLDQSNFKNSFYAADSQNGKFEFENLVKKGVQAIENGDFKKVVLSRKEIVQLTYSDFILPFKKMLHQYPTAFRYCWFHPEIGLWLGATPERLIHAENGKFDTMALAGTQIFEGSEDVRWQSKEIEEQKFVTDFIVDSLQKEVSELKVSEPYTTKAGNLLHIKTDIEGVLSENSDLKTIVAILHPTPAVCGFPKDAAKQFIIKNEGYKRDFYSGFLGELNIDLENGKATTDLYVNLRCMQMRGNVANLYMGCGITKDSDPEKEYLETVNKSLTMKNIL